jgi:hypothetical protein
MALIRRPRLLTVERYSPTAATQWNAFVDASKNGTFLLRRDYMDYHADRFVDESLIIRENSEIVALLPAHRLDGTLQSHMGLTYGGCILSTQARTPLVLEVFAVILEYMRHHGISTLVYKTIPHIYHRMPAEEDRYALFRYNAVLYRRDLLSTVDMERRPTPQQRRQRGAARALKAGVEVGESSEWAAYWAVLESHLQARYGVSPVHRLHEIQLLRSRFPDKIRLFTAVCRRELLGGVVMYEPDEVAHLQYAAATPTGLAVGCLDRLFLYLLEEVFARKRWFDFGNSTEQQGRWLNDGLIEQKEGFGGRAVAHDFYRLIA